MKRSKGRKMNIDRQAKSCGKAAPWKPLETGVPTALGNPATDAGFPLSHSCNNNKLDDRDHFQQNAKTSVASLRGLIGSSWNIDRHRSGMLIDFIGIPNEELEGPLFSFPLWSRSPGRLQEKRTGTEIFSPFLPFSIFLK
jgi:hypothetical protein